MDDEHVLAFIEAVDGANLDAVHVFALNAIVGDDIGHLEQAIPRMWGLSGGRRQQVVWLLALFRMARK
jgi:hypothetical protein